MENEKQNKLSKLAVISAVFVFFTYVGLIKIGVTYSSIYEVLFGIFTDLIAIGIFYWIMKMVQREKMKGLILAQFSFYGFTAIIVVWSIATIFVSKKLDEVKDFAVNITPTILTEDLSKFDSYATDDFKKLLKYDKEFKSYKDKMKEVGVVQECSFNETDNPTINFGPYISYGNLRIGYTGSFGITCYGSEKAVIVGMTLKKIDNEWKISDFAFNANVTKNVDVEEQEKIKLSNQPAKE